jgi:hypothetical protein
VTLSQKQLETGWNSSWNQQDRDTIWENDPDVRLQMSHPEAPAPPPQRSRPHPRAGPPQSHRGAIPKNKIRREPTWYPPTLSSQENNIIAEELHHLPHITPQQQQTIKDWLYSLGFSVHQHEGGGCFSSTTASTHPLTSNGLPLELKDDRLRNGELLCDLVCLLEPNASKHSQLQQLIYRHPISLTHVMSNLERALWLLRIRKCPPIPMVFLTHPQLIMEGHREVIWGLLNEMRRAYPLPSNLLTTHASPSISLNSQLPLATGVPPLAPNATGGVGARQTTLPYTLQDRKLLDQSLVLWLINEGILSGIMEGLLSTNLPSITTLEGPLRDGTLLCLLINKLFGNPIKGYHKSSKTYATSISNVIKCLNVLRLQRQVSRRFLYEGVEHEIVRGEWSVLLGLLEDMHKFRDGVFTPTTNQKSTSPGDGIQKPYLGEMQYEWPPPLESSEEQRVFIVESHLRDGDGNGDGGVLSGGQHPNLKHNVPIDRVLYPVAERNPLKERTKHNIQKVAMGKRGDARSLSPPPPPPLDDDSSTEGARESNKDIIPAGNQRGGQERFGKNPIRKMRQQYVSRRHSNRHQEDEEGAVEEGKGQEKKTSQDESDYHPPTWQPYQHRHDITPGTSFMRHDLSLTHPIAGAPLNEPRYQNDLQPKPNQFSFGAENQSQDGSEGEGEEGEEVEDDMSDVARRGSVSGSSSNDSRRGHNLSQSPKRILGHDLIPSSSYRGPPRSGQLRVQAATSRHFPNPLLGREEGVRGRGKGQGDEADENEESKSLPSSSLKQLREDYEKENRLNSQRHRHDRQQREDREDEESWNHIAASFYQGKQPHHTTDDSDSGNSPPNWINEIQPTSVKERSDRRDPTVKNHLYDENYSVTSTPPQEKQHHHSLVHSPNRQKFRLSVSSSGLLDSHRLKSLTTVFRWLVKLGLIPSSSPPLEIPKDSVRDSDLLFIPSFQDGVLLAKLIQRLERCDPISGVTQQPKSRAQKLQNIRKVLNFLSQNKKIPLSALSIEEEILEGNSIAIVDLLLKIKDVYKFKAKFVQ